ncbi:unnamed protein product, partial [marine sediment metagenome]
GGIILSVAGSYAAADGMIAQALAMAQEIGDDHLLGLGLAAKAAHHFAYMESQAVDTGLRAAELLRSAGDPWYMADALWATQFGLVWLGRLDEAAKISDELEPLAAGVGNMVALMMAGRSRGARDAMLTGDSDAVEAFAKDDLELCRSAGMPWISNSYCYLGQAHFWRGRWEEALENSQEAARLEPPGFLAGGDWGYLFLMNAYSGDRDAALAMLRQKRGGAISFRSRHTSSSGSTAGART